MALGKWFDQDFFAGQKLAQLGVLGQTVPATGTDVEKLQAVIDAYNTAHGTAVTIESNFEACNQSGYITSAVNRNDINVSPNALFDVRYYLTALAENANETGYPAGDAAAGSWTAESVLQHMYEGGYSAWSHFMGDGLDRMIDCSSSFNTKAYLEDKATATNQTVEEVIAEMKAAGLNPVMDYFENGVDLGIKARPVATPLTVTMPENGQWLTDSVPPVDTDPYDEIAEHVAIAAGDNGPYEGQDGVNTQFDAVYSKENATTLNANDVITGGTDAFNTLAVSLGDNWGGFNGTGTGILDKAPSVTNVGRVVINREVGSAETGFTFNAKNISEDTVRFDINTAGTGATSLTNLSDGVNEVNISGLRPMDAGANAGKTNATALKFVNSANAGSDDVLTIGLTNTGSAKAPAPVTWDTDIETVIINSKGTAANGIDINSATGVKEVDIKGAADVTVQTTANSTLKTYDMSEATGKVTLNAYNLSNQAVIGGQHAEDSVMLGSGGTVTAKNWSGVENVTFGAESGATTFGADGAEGIKAFWIANKGTYTVKDLAADDITVYQTKDAKNPTGTTTINGKMTKGDSSLGNITWQSQTGEDNPTAGVKAMFSSNADGTATVKLTGQDYLADTSSFKFGNATKLVIDDPNPTKDGVTAAGALSTGVTLVAPNVTDMDVTLSGPMKFVSNAGGNDTALASVKNLTLTLTDTEVATGKADVFDMGDINLKAAQNVTVNGGGEVVYLGKLGTTGTGSDASANLTLDVSDVSNFAVGDIGVGLGQYVQATIESSGLVQFGNITSSTNAQNNTLGDVFLEVSGSKFVKSSAANATGFTVSGGDLTLDFSGITAGAGDDAVGATGSGNGLTLNAQGGITYTGAAGKDYIEVTGVGEGSTSNISTGGGKDEVTLDFSGVKFSRKDARATINVDMESDGVTDKLDLTNAVGANNGLVIINVENFDTGPSSGGNDILPTYAYATGNLGAGVATKFGISGGEQVAVVGGVPSSVSNFNGLVVGNDVCVFNSLGATDATVMIRLQGVAEDVIDVTGGKALVVAIS